MNVVNVANVVSVVSDVGGRRTATGLRRKPRK